MMTDISFLDELPLWATLNNLPVELNAEAELEHI